jgi:sialate O-acetylesterase
LAGTGDRLPLEHWQYKKPANDVGYPPRTPWEPISGLSTLHNAMLAPLHDLSLRGALWYQGESDTGMGGAYEGHMSALKAQWREQFGENLPVFVVQLANYGNQPPQPTESGWAAVRDAQRQATQGDPNAGLAVTIDIGSPYNIHPTNKKEIGHRLTHAGRAIVYGHDLTLGSPLPTKASPEGDAIAVLFQQVKGSLIAYSHDAPIGFELCGVETGCHFADAEIEGNRVLLTAEEVNDPSRVRYCWADSPVCTLYDEAGLPASPFELEIGEN